MANKRVAAGYYYDATLQRWVADAYLRGRRVRRVAKDERAAAKLYRDIMHALEHGLPVPQQRGGPRPVGLIGRTGAGASHQSSALPDALRLDEALVSYVTVSRRKPSAKEIIRSCERWAALFGHLAVDELDRMAVEEALERRAAATSNSARNWDLTVLRAAIHRAILARRATYDVTAGIQRLPDNRRRKRLRAGQGEALLASLPTDQDRRIVIWILNTGLRRRNALEVEWAWIDFAECILFIPRVKGGASLTVPLNSAAMAVLEEQRRHSGHLRHVWCGPSGKPVNPRNWWKRVLRPSLITSGLIPADEADSGKMPAFRTHDLRHAFVTRSTGLGVHPQRTQRLAGHADIATTMSYSHEDVEDLREAAELIAWIPSYCPRIDGNIRHLCASKRLTAEQTNGGSK